MKNCVLCLCSLSLSKLEYYWCDRFNRRYLDGFLIKFLFGELQSMLAVSRVGVAFWIGWQLRVGTSQEIRLSLIPWRYGIEAKLDFAWRHCIGGGDIDQVCVHVRDPCDSFVPTYARLLRAESVNQEEEAEGKRNRSTQSDPPRDSFQTAELLCAYVHDPYFCTL